MLTQEQINFLIDLRSVLVKHRYHIRLDCYGNNHVEPAVGNPCMDTLVMDEIAIEDINTVLCETGRRPS